MLFNHTVMTGQPDDLSNKGEKKEQDHPKEYFSYQYLRFFQVDVRQDRGIEFFSNCTGEIAEKSFYQVLYQSGNQKPDKENQYSKDQLRKKPDSGFFDSQQQTIKFIPQGLMIHIQFFKFYSLIIIQWRLFE